MRRTGPLRWLLDHIRVAALMFWSDLFTVASYWRGPKPLPPRTRQGNLPYRTAADADLFHELEALLDPRSLVPEPRRPTP
jgi:hypothetical protein